MNSGLMRAKQPEEEELAAKQAELERLSDALVEKELEVRDLGLSLARFETRYFRQVGAKYAELDELRARIAEERLQRDPENAQLRGAASDARERAAQTAKEYEGRRRDREREEAPAVPEDIKRLYRDIARLIHPDKSTDEKSRAIRTKLMADLTNAYSRCDRKRMREILAEWESSPDSVSGEGTASELVRVIRAISQVRRRISQVNEEICRLKASDMCRLMIRVRDAEKEGIDILAEMASVVQKQIHEAKQELARSH